MATKPAKDPVFSDQLPHGEIFGAAEGADGRRPRYVQNGHYFAGDRSYLHSDPQVAKLIEEPQSESKPPESAPAITDEKQIAELLKDPRADQLLALGRDVFLDVMREAGGPIISGEGSQRMMAAWLIKNVPA
jgi:hypothetical protein